MADNRRPKRRRIAILGTRGIPAAHGGFETFVERLAPYLATTGWDVSVYCQEDRSLPATLAGPSRWTSVWEGVKRVHITVDSNTPFNSILFDALCIAHVTRERPDVVLMLGYNTAIFTLQLRIARIPTVINMDGIEWTRKKWSVPAKAWLYLNEWAACLLGTHLIADHPQIARHLRSRVKLRKLSVIPYGSDLLDVDADTPGDPKILGRFGVSSKSFATVIARPEPENSVLEMVRTFSARKRGIKLLVLGNYCPRTMAYHAEILAAASEEVIFAGAVYEKSVVQTLRRHSLFYMHGHQVGGCNPSLLEAMGAGNPVLAHDNRFNRWVAKDGALYFRDGASCERALDELLTDRQQLLVRSRLNRLRVQQTFNWNDILRSYEELMTYVAPAAAAESLSGWGRRAHWQLDGDPS
jgi:glycosyltransferase involved in cell wall biosynthesis